MTTMETLLDDTEAAAKRMREIYEKWERLREAQQAYIEDLESQRDALRAQLDNMTTEWGVAFGSLILTEDERGGGVSEQENRALLEADPSLTLIRRGVTPWVEVTD